MIFFLPGLMLLNASVMKESQAELREVGVKSTLSRGCHKGGFVHAVEFSRVRHHVIDLQQSNSPIGARSS